MAGENERSRDRTSPLPSSSPNAWQGEHLASLSGSRKAGLTHRQGLHLLETAFVSTNSYLLSTCHAPATAEGQGVEGGEEKGKGNITSNESSRHVLRNIQLKVIKFTLER